MYTEEDQDINLPYYFRFIPSWHYVSLQLPESDFFASFSHYIYILTNHFKLDMYIQNGSKCVKETKVQTIMYKNNELCKVLILLPQLDFPVMQSCCDNNIACQAKSYLILVSVNLFLPQNDPMASMANKLGYVVDMGTWIREAWISGMSEYGLLETRNKRIVLRPSYGVH